MSQVPPFDWQHAELDEIRQFVLSEVMAGRFKPSTGLAL